MGSELIEAAQEALCRWDEAVPHIDGAIMMATIHHCPYAGPNVGEAMEGLRAALAAARACGLTVQSDDR